MTTLDEVTRNTDFSMPEFIKLDTQGAELAVLEGGGNTLRSAEAVLMEVSLLEIYSEVPLFDRAVALWQTDVIFVKTSSPLVALKSWGRHP